MTSYIHLYKLEFKIFLNTSFNFKFVTPFKVLIYFFVCLSPFFTDLMVFSFIFRALFVCFYCIYYMYSVSCHDCTFCITIYFGPFTNTRILKLLLINLKYRVRNCHYHSFILKLHRKCEPLILIFYG